MEVSITSKVKVYIMCVYRAPGTDIAQFNMEFEDILDKMKNRKIFICGDLNIDLLKCDSHNGTKHFVDLLYSNGYFPLISRPTRITENSGTLIDNIFTSEISVGIKSGILINDITDHLPIFASIPYYSKKEEEVKEVFKRAVTSVGIENLKRDLSTVDWSFITGEQDPNRAYKKFMEIFNCFFNKHCPIKKVNSMVNELSKPWLTTSLKNACKKKNSLYKDFLKYKTVSAEFKYKRYKNKLITILRNAEKEYYSRLLHNHSNDIKGTWKILNGILRTNWSCSNIPKEFKKGNGSVSTRAGVVNGFNDFFVNVGAELAAKIPERNDTNFLRFLGAPVEQSLFLTMVTPEEIVKETKKFKSKHSSGIDDINMHTVKSVIEEIVIPITHICNRSFLTGTVPNDMKNAKVIPIYKAGERNLFSNYRPVSLLPQFSKILERLFSNRLIDFIEKKDVLYQRQYGFRNNMSTASAIIELTEEITNAMDESKYTIGVFIDLKKLLIP